MDVVEAIYNRRSVRNYTDQPVDKAAVDALIKAATHAPSSMNEQPWAFIVIQDSKRLASWSERIKAYVLKRLKPDSPLSKYRDMLSSPDYDVFHRAGTLIIICSRRDAHHGEGDCCLAAENLMLAAYAMGLSQAKIKRSLSIPDAYAPAFPVVVGYPSGDTPAVQRRSPEILLWE